MAELTGSDRLQPSLWDRLTDEEPKRLRESRNERVITVRELRQAVLRDLGALLNTAPKLDEPTCIRFPRVGASILNYGSPDLTGATGSSVSQTKLREAIIEAVKRYEPRLLPETVRVRVSASGGANPNGIAIEILGDLWANPTPDSMFIRTELDLETGQCSLADAGRG